MKQYINVETGEIIVASGRRKAVRYFKADGKMWGYKVHFWSVKRFK